MGGGGLPVLIAGAGVAGLSAAIAFARAGRDARLIERSPEFETLGAGIQLAPNATRLLNRFGALERLRARAVRPEAIVLRSARNLRELARIPLGDFAEARWGAPYVVAHRADLHAALRETAREHPGIDIRTGIGIEGFAADGETVRARLSGGEEMAVGLLVGADGVWSTLRSRLDGAPEAHFSGRIAWRATLGPGSPWDGYTRLPEGAVVCAFLDPRFHLVAYPVRRDGMVNLIAVTRGRDLPKSWSNRADPAELAALMRGAHAALREACLEAEWTRWPINVVAGDGRWSDPRGMALIGDAAHAMDPSAAQGAAMAIEDAVALSDHVAQTCELTAALADWDEARRARIARVRRRGALNAFTWNAWGPFAIGRDIVFRLAGPRRLAAQLDWLYGYEVSRE